MPLFNYSTKGHFITLTHTRLTALCPGLPRWASTIKVKPIKGLSPNVIDVWMLLALMAKKPPKTAVSANGYTGTTQQKPAQQDDMSNLNKNTHTHTRLMALCPWLPRWDSTKKVNQSGFYWSKRQWVTVASAGSLQVCTSLQTDNHASTPPLSFFTGRMPFLPPNQQCQSIEGKTNYMSICHYSITLQKAI